jgi:hypothetical protein
MRKKYTSFEEIDRDLRILELSREIELENLKLTYSEAKESLYPKQLLGGLGGIIQKIAITLLAKRIMALFK